MNLNRYDEKWSANDQIYIMEIKEELNKDNEKLNKLIEAILGSKNLLWDFLEDEWKMARYSSFVFRGLLFKLKIEIDNIRFIKPDNYNRTFIAFPDTHIYKEISEFDNPPIDLHYTEISMEDFIKEISVDELKINNTSSLLEKY